MEEVLLKKILRQLKFLNALIVCFGLLTVAALVIFAVLLFSVVTVARDALKKADSVQQTVQQDTNVTQQVCNNSSIKSFADSTGLCK